MKDIYRIFASMLAVCLLTACSEMKFGDKLLDRQPESKGADLDEMFSSRISAETVLTKAYTFLPYGIFTDYGGTRNKLGVAVMENITDLCQSCLDSSTEGPHNLYYTGALSSNISSTLRGSEAYRYGSEVDWSAIRYAWMYIENVHKVPDMSQSEKDERIAEAKMIIAISYTDMLRNVGGVCWIDHAIDVNENMHFPRLTFAQTVEKIENLLNEAIPVLKWKWDSRNDGRMTKAGAMALKLRLLTFAASPTFNSDKIWHPQADEYTCYGNYEKARWEKAKKAGDDFMLEWEKNGEYGLTQSSDGSFNAKRKAYQSAYYDRGGTEVLISTRMGYNESVHNLYFQERHFYGPTLNYVNMFPWADGTAFPDDFDWTNPEKQPFFEEDGTPTRDPRLYENVVVPGDYYYDGNIAPVYSNHPNPQEGTGFLMMKFILQSKEDRANRPTQWPYLRLPEVLLSYAEAINEVNQGPDATAYRMINDVRARVGLGSLPEKLGHGEFLEALIKERALELGFEEVRWYDLIRRGREEDFRKILYGLKTVADSPLNPKSFTFETKKLEERFWVKNWDTKWYLSPIPVTETNKKYGMTQNPGW